MRRTTDITHLGRGFDFRLPSNRIALLAPIAAGLVVFLLDTDNPRRAVVAAVATFAAWTIAREMDPDHPHSATVAAGLAPVATVAVGTPQVGPLFLVMVIMRILTRSTGLAPKSTDLLVLTGAAILVAGTPWGWAAGIALAFAMVRDVALGGEPPPNAGLWALATAVGVTVRVAWSAGLGDWSLPLFGEWVVLAAGVAGAAVVLQPTTVVSLGDWTRTPLDPRRVREAAAFGISAAVLAAVAAGGAGIVATAPLLLSYPAVAAVRLFPWATPG